MLTDVSLENLKSFKSKTTFKLSQFNAFIGENGSGKSTVLHALALIKQNIGNNQLSDGALIALGGFERLVNNPEASVLISIGGFVRPSFVASYSYLHNLNYYVEIEFSPDIKYSRLMLSLNLSNIVSQTYNEELSQYLKKHDAAGNPIIFDLVWNKNNPHVVQTESIFYDEQKKERIEPISLGISGSTLMPKIRLASSSSKYNAIRLQIEKVIQSINEAISNDIANISYVPALRGISSSQYSLQEGGVKEFVNPYDFNQQAETLLSYLEYNREYADQLSSHISKVINRKTRTRLVHGRKVTLDVFNGKQWVNILNEGYGINPLVHCILQLVIAPANSTILLEEPEIHLHPAAQTRLSSVLEDILLQENKQVILTTHSEHILFGLLEGIMQGKIQNNQLTIHYFEREADASKVLPLTITERGEVIGGMKGFFEADLEHIEKFYRAIKERKKESESDLRREHH